MKLTCEWVGVDEEVGRPCCVRRRRGFEFLHRHRRITTDEHLVTITVHVCRIHVFALLLLLLRCIMGAVFVVITIGADALWSRTEEKTQKIAM